MCLKMRLEGKMSDNMIMITNLFPYGNDTGEMYLRTELKILSEKFDYIYILATDASEKDIVYTEDLPVNVKFFPLASKNTVLLHNKYLYGVFKCKKKYYNEEFRIEKKECNSLMKKLFLRYFVYRCWDKSKEIEQIINKLPTDGEHKIVIYSYRLFDLAYLALSLKKKLLLNQCLCVSRAHGYDLYEEENVLRYLPMRKYILKNMDFIFPCSNDGKIYLQKKYPKYKGKIICSYLGSTDMGVEEINSSNCFNLVSCSTILPVKRVDRIAAIVEKINEYIPIRWIHIGGESKGLDKLIRKYQKLVNEEVMIFLGKKSHKEIERIYQMEQFDAFINVSISEGIPQAIMEALSAGIPVLATDVGGNREIVVDEYNGYLFPSNFNDRDVVEKILVLSKMSYLEKCRLHECARKQWENKFKSSDNSKQFVDFLASKDFACFME